MFQNSSYFHYSLLCCSCLYNVSELFILIFELIESEITSELSMFFL